MRKLPISFPNEKTIRVITDTDTNNECDDQYCVAHLWMTPKFDNRAMISAHYGSERDPISEPRSYEELCKLAELMGIKGEVNILHGAPAELSDEETPVISEGARFIVEEAMRDDPRPLFVCSIGAITDLASAYLMEPRIAEKITAIWIGGSPYPEGGYEFNQNNDIHAANVVFQSNLVLWQVPSNVYSQMRVSFMELIQNVYPCGRIGKYLVENTMRVQEIFKELGERIRKEASENPDAPAPAMFCGTPAEAATGFGGEQWCLGDSPVVGLMHNNMIGNFTIRSAPYKVNPDGTYDLSKPGSRKIRVYDSIDSHFILNDMFAKLQFYFR